VGYRLGIDVGTTWTAAAVARDDGSLEVVGLGTHGAVVPTLIHVAVDGTTTIGEVAARRGAAQPDRLAREVKRRVGDTVPVLLGGSPHAPEALLASVAASVALAVTELEGGPAEGVCVTHPANWGPLRRELYEGALRRAGVVPLTLATEPEAAAAHYAAAERVPTGTTIAVYDLGGGTFDATVLRKAEGGFEVLGVPDGVDRLGGLDFDAAVLAHVAAALGPAWDALDIDDPAVQAGVARLRAACVAAKEALSSDNDAAISVTLPGLVTEVRITRSEFEQMIRPAIATSVDALRRAVDGAGVAMADVDRILLVGGSSRIPLVSELLGALGRPLAVDTHPKHAVALGAARYAGPAGEVVDRNAPPGSAVAVDRPSRTGRRWRVLVAAVIGLAIGSAVLASQLAGDDPAGDGAEVATDVSTTTTTTEVVGDPIGLVDLAGGYALELTSTGCEPGGALCPESASVNLLVRCGDGGNCTVEFPDAFTGGAVDLLEDDGRFVAAGSGDPGAALPCAAEPPPSWNLTISAPASEGGSVESLAGQLEILAGAGCEITSVSYDLSGRRGEVGDQIATLAGGWNLVIDVQTCTGDACFPPPDDAIPLEIRCVGSTCTVAFAGGDPATLADAAIVTTTTNFREAFGDLPLGVGLTCDGNDVATRYGFTVETELDGAGRLIGSLTMTSDAAGGCGATTLQASFEGLSTS
jgi:molecular chaperone DnaK (HSP70)